MRFSVSLSDGGSSFHCGDQQNLLEGMQTFQVGVPLLKLIPVGCRGGGCGVCRIRILDGQFETKKMSRKHVSDQEQAEGVALACRVYPRSDLCIELLSSAENDNNHSERESL